MLLSDYKETLPDLLKNYRSVVDGAEMSGDDVARVLMNITEHLPEHEGFQLGGLDRRVAVATTLLRKEKLIKMGRKGWEVVK
jgi:hypothetical protein